MQIELHAAECLSYVLNVPIMAETGFHTCMELQMQHFCDVASL